MSQSVPVAFVQQFEDNVHVLAQQMGSKFRGAVREKTITGKYGHFERVGAVEMVQRTSRHQNTALVDTPHSRRRVIPLDYEVADLVDDQDARRMLISPGSEYAQNFARAMNRRFDDTVIAAAIGSSTAVDENDTASSITLASFASGAHVIAAGGTGFTLAKLIQAKRLLDLQDTPEDGRHVAISPHGLEDLLDDPEVTSADFNSVKALVRGELNTYLGFTFHKSTRLAISSTTRSCFAWHESAIGVALVKDMQTRMSERDDKGYALQVYSCMSLGAVRIEEAKVVQVDITE